MTDSNLDARDATTEPADEPPVPPRYWWLKRIGITVGALAVLMIALRLWWGWYAERQLQAAIDKIIAAGEPIYPEDFDPPEPVPDDQNAAKLLREAENALTLTLDETKLIESMLDDSALFRYRFDDLRKLVESNAKVLDLIHRARGCSAVDWGVRVCSPAITTTLPPLSGQRTLGKILFVTALCRHTTGEDSGAVETLRDGLALGRALDAGPWVISHLVASGIDSRIVYAIEKIAPSLEIGTEDDHPSPNALFASADQVSALIAELLDEDKIREGMTRAFHGERMQQLDAVLSVIDGQLKLSQLYSMSSGNPALVLELFPTFITRPFYCTDAVFAVEWMTAYVEACRASNWPAAKAVAPAEPRSVSNWERTVHPVSWLTMPSLERAMLLHFRALTMRRMAGIALAMRLYGVDHGRRPETLDELVPGYLASVPLDSFAADGRAIGYHPDATPPMLYSISVDGVDDGGAFIFRIGGGLDVEKLDIPFFLDGYRPHYAGQVPAPWKSVPPGQSDRDEKNAGGDADEHQHPE